MTTSIGGLFPGDVQPLILALQAGVLTMPPGQALQLVDEWQTKLAGTGQPELAGIATELGTLKGLLSGGGQIDRDAIKESLGKLSSQVSMLASGSAGAAYLTPLSAALDQNVQAL